MHMQRFSDVRAISRAADVAEHSRSFEAFSLCHRMHYRSSLGIAALKEDPIQPTHQMHLMQKLPISERDQEY